MPAEVVLMMDLAGVLTTSPFPAARRLAETMMRCVFERAGAHLLKRKGNNSVAFLARKYSNFFFIAIDFTERTLGSRSAFEKLELGEIHRQEFIVEFEKEIKLMLAALSKENMEELEEMNIAYPKRVDALKRRFPLLCDPIIQTLVVELLEVEAFLCTMEKVTPRKNVLNLLHYLRVKSKQEIRLFAMGNNWETEGQYRRMTKAMSQNLNDSVSTAFPVSCPIIYKDAGSFNNYFHVNGLFDGYVQSYVLHKRKPYPDIFMHAVSEIMSGRTPTGEALRYDLKPHIFYFDDIGDHCEIARELPGNPFTEVFLIEDGACDVYKDILRALKTVAQKDAFWRTVVEGVEKDIGPLFKAPVNSSGKSVSWVTEELDNYNDNLLFLPPPLYDLCEPVNVMETERYHMDGDDQDAILFYCAQHLPHLFPLAIPDRYRKGLKLAQQPGLATSAGPIVFEYITTSNYFEAYRITLRTGSYVLRIQPPGPNPFGSAGIRREFEMMSHLHESAPGVKVPKMLLYCDSDAVCGRRFFLGRYRDGEAITSIQMLIQPRIRRPYSERRRIVNVELRPKLFYKAAVGALAALHDSTLPRFMRHKEERLPLGTARVHPLLLRVRGCLGRYNLIVADTNQARLLRSATIEELGKSLIACFDQTRLGQELVPSPERYVAIHGSFDMSSLIFSHRSLEGRAKYPPKHIGTVKFHFTRLDDPLLDVATLSLFTFIPAPEGIFGVSKNTQMLFPSPGEILEYYCNTRGYMRHLDRGRREDIFNVYLATLCLQRAVMTLVELAGALRKNPADLPAAKGRSVAFADQLARRGLELLLKRRGAHM